MMQKLRLGLVSASLLFSVQVSAMHHDLRPGISIEYDFAPNKPELITNISIMPITVICTLHVPNTSGSMQIKGIRGSGEIGMGETNIQVSKGMDFRLPIHNGDKMILKAKTGSQVEFTNKGQETVKAVCKTV